MTPVIAATFAFDDIGEAFDRLTAGGNLGKVAVTIER